MIRYFVYILFYLCYREFFPMRDVSFTKREQFRRHGYFDSGIIYEDSTSYYIVGCAGTGWSHIYRNCLHTSWEIIGYLGKDNKNISKNTDGSEIIGHFK